MMNSVYVDPVLDSRWMLDSLYRGQIVVRSPSAATKQLVEHAREAITAAFAGYNPLMAQHDLGVEDFVDRFAPLKAAFIHDPRSRALIAAVLAELEFDPDDTYIDVPRLRVATSHGYLTSGVAYAHHPHRDTWYSAPLSQINWWMPIYDFESSASMAFHPRYWTRPVRNGSDSFDYYRWNSEGRANARAHVRSDTRPQPKPEEPLDLEPELRLITRPGGLIAFSAAQLHSTVSNQSGKTRWSLDFRTVSLADTRARRGAPNLDSRPTGTSLRDFLKMRDCAPMPLSIVRLYDDRESVEGTFVYPGDRR